MAYIGIRSSSVRECEHENAHDHLNLGIKWSFFLAVPPPLENLFTLSRSYSPCQDGLISENLGNGHHCQRNFFGLLLLLSNTAVWQQSLRGLLSSLSGLMSHLRFDEETSGRRTKNNTNATARCGTFGTGRRHKKHRLPHHNSYHGLWERRQKASCWDSALLGEWLYTLNYARHAVLMCTRIAFFSATLILELQR